MEEIWKPVVGYEGRYEVSSLGRVRSLNCTEANSIGVVHERKGRVLIGNPDSQGYLGVSLWIKGERKRMQIHRLVAVAFIDNPLNKSQVDHINTNKADNRVENLRWATPSENQRNPVTLERIRTREITEETKEKMRYAALHRSPETLRKMSEGSRKENLSLETRRRMSEAQKGKVHTEEHKKKISNSLLGNKRNLGNKASEATRERMKASHREKYSVPVLQYGLGGEFLKRWETQYNAVAALGAKSPSPIIACCKGQKQSAYGYVWKFGDHSKSEQ